jgi:hypothetical protein
MAMLARLLTFFTHLQNLSNLEPVKEQIRPAAHHVMDTQSVGYGF